MTCAVGSLAHGHHADRVLVRTHEHVVLGLLDHVLLA
jgi:hypothetical protein